MTKHWILNSNRLTPGKTLFIHSQSLFITDLIKLQKKLGFIVKPVYHSGGWLRDEILLACSVENPDDLHILIGTPVEQSKIREVRNNMYIEIRKYLRNEVTPFKNTNTIKFFDNIIGTQGGAAIFDANITVPDLKYEFEKVSKENHTDVTGIPLEGGNMIILNKDIFIGSESLEIGNRLLYNQKNDYLQILKQTFTKQKIHVLDQFLWHLDLYILPITDNIVCVPIINPNIVRTNRQKNEIEFTNNDEKLYYFLNQFKKKLEQNIKLLKKKKYIVIQMDGFFAKSGRSYKMLGSYFNSLSGSDKNGQHYILMPNYGNSKHQIYVKNQLEQKCKRLGIDIEIYFVGFDPNKILINLNKYGGSLRCTTNS